MNLKRIEDIYTSLNEIIPKVSVLTKVKLRLYLLSLKPFIEIIEEVRKDIVNDDVRTFEEKRQEITQSSSSEYQKNLDIMEYIQNNPTVFESYNKAVKNIEDIYKYECEVKEIRFTLDEIPDEVVDLSEQTQSIIFSLVDE